MLADAPPDRPPSAPSRRWRLAGLAAVALALLAAALGRVRPPPTGEPAVLFPPAVTTNPAGQRLGSILVSNRLDRPLAWLAFGQLDTDPPTNRAARPLAGYTTTWVLAPHESRIVTFGVGDLPAELPWRLSLFCRPWRGWIGEHLDDLREAARSRGLPFAPPRLYHGIASEWMTAPAPADGRAPAPRRGTRNHREDEDD
jgi:hypothetical protein